MPLLGLQSYKIDFVVLETNDPKSITILDKSTYLSTPEYPLVEVTLPGYTGHVELAYTPNNVIILNSDNLGLTEGVWHTEYAPLPDGVYKIKLKVCPYDELYDIQCYLKATTLEQAYKTFLLEIEKATDCFDEQKLVNELINIDILIQSAKIEASSCNINAATEKYKVANRKLSDLNKKLKCS